MGFPDISCYNSEISTPNIDMLAKNGIRFSQCYNSFTCVLSYRNLLTRYYFNQVERLHANKGNIKPKWVQPLPHCLSELRYRCYHSGKWHLSNLKAVSNAGFDRLYLLNDTNRCFSPQKHSLDDIASPPVSADEGYYAMQVITDYAINFVESHYNSYNNSCKPFFLYLTYTAPHFPLHGIDEDIKLFSQTYNQAWNSIQVKRWQNLKDMKIVNCELSEHYAETPPPIVLNGTHGGIKSPLSILIKSETPMTPNWNELTDNQKKIKFQKCQFTQQW